MIYTDLIHMTADTHTELHEFAEKIGLKRHRYHGSRKGHPHYDLVSKGKRRLRDENGESFLDKALMYPEFRVVSTRELLAISQKLKFDEVLGNKTRNGEK